MLFLLYTCRWSSSHSSCKGLLERGFWFSPVTLIQGDSVKGIQSNKTRKYLPQTSVPRSSSDQQKLLTTCSFQGSAGYLTWNNTSIKLVSHQFTWWNRSKLYRKKKGAILMANIASMQFANNALNDLCSSPVPSSWSVQMSK